VLKFILLKGGDGLSVPHGSSTVTLQPCGRVVKMSSQGRLSVGQPATAGAAGVEQLGLGMDI